LTLSLIAALSLALTTTSCTDRQNFADATSETTAQNIPSKATNTQSVVLRVGFISTESKIPIGPEGWALEKGTLASELKPLGVSEVKFIPFVGGPALNEALASDSLDLGLYGDTPALAGRSAGLKTKLINQTRVGQNAWLVTKKNGPRTVEDLKGGKIGVAKGTYPHRYLLGLLDQKGLTSNVKLVQIQGAEAKVALERGDIAAYPFAMGAGPTVIAQGFPVIDQAIDHQGLVGTGVTIATVAFLSKHPDFPQKWNQIRQQAVQEIKANPEVFYQFAAKASGGLSLPAVKESYPLSLYPPQPFTPEGLKLLNSTKQFLVAQKLLKSDFNIKDWQIPNP